MADSLEVLGEQPSTSEERNVEEDMYAFMASYKRQGITDDLQIYKILEKLQIIKGPASE